MQIRNILSKSHTEILVHAVITSRLDNCNSLFINTSKANLHKLQKVQNAAARLVIKGNKRTPITETLKNLHWLRVESRIVFKVLLLVFKSLHNLSPKNSKMEFKSSSNRSLLDTKSFNNTQYGRRTFSYAGPRLWNALPLNIRTEVENLKSIMGISSIPMNTIMNSA